MLSRTAANGTCAPRTSAEPPRTSRSVLRIQYYSVERSREQPVRADKTPKTPRSSANRISVFSVAFCILSTRAQALPRAFSLRPSSPQPLHTALQLMSSLMTFFLGLSFHFVSNFHTPSHSGSGECSAKYSIRSRNVRATVSSAFRFKHSLKHSVASDQFCAR